MAKGQAAIEYLATYGWMLAAVAMVSGVIYSSTGASFCNSQVTGFTGQSLRVEDYGLSANSADMQLSVENQDSQGFYNHLKEIKIKNQDTGKRIVTSPTAQIINPGISKVFDINGFETSNECNTFRVQITYDRKDILPNQKAVGTIQANAEIFSESYDPYNPADDTSNFEPTIDSTNSPVEEGETLQVDYTVENTGTQNGSQQIEFIYNDTIEGNNSVNLSPAESTSGTFTYTPSREGEYPVEVATNNETASTTVTVNEPT